MTALPPATNETALPAPFSETLTAFLRHAFSWRANLEALRSPNMVLLGAGLLLPNLLSLATLGSFIDIGFPPRTGCILLYAMLAICARRLPFALTAILFIALIGFDMVWTLSLMFGLAPSELLVALDHARRIHFFASPLYMSLIGAMVATTGFTLYLLSRRAKLLQGNIYLLLGVTVVFAALDFVTNVSAHYQYGSTFGRNVPVISAADASGFNEVAGANGRNVVMVIVESLGYMLNAKDRALIDSPLSDPRITREYRVTSGTATYYGSTTAGEMRELCHTRRFYAKFAPKYGYSCLPDLLDRRGYTSIAFHAFSGGMFERKFWYPRLGFKKVVFGRQIVQETHRTCGGAFRGACDSDMAPVIVKDSQELAPPGKPRFIYWLTLNTHIPIKPGDAHTNYDCSGPGNPFHQGTVCRMAELWHDFFDTITKVALDPSIGPAEILIVGDHAPPIWSKRGRAMFAAGKVAWYRLTPR
jgi:Sulfatase